MKEKAGIEGGISEKEAISLCRKLATEIEVSMWLMHNESLSNDYKNKFRSLCFNLQSAANTELRISILSGNIKASELPKFDSIQLAPAQLKQRREEREQKYFREQVLLEADMSQIVLIGKSRKGEMILKKEDYGDIKTNNHFKDIRENIVKANGEVKVGSIKVDTYYEKIKEFYNTYLHGDLRDLLLQKLHSTKLKLDP